MIAAITRLLIFFLTHDTLLPSPSQHPDLTPLPTPPPPHTHTHTNTNIPKLSLTIMDTFSSPQFLFRTVLSIRVKVLRQIFIYGLLIRFF